MAPRGSNRERERESKLEWHQEGVTERESKLEWHQEGVTERVTERE